MLSVGHKNLVKTTFRIVANIKPISIIAKSIRKNLVPLKNAMFPSNFCIKINIKKSRKSVIAVQIKVNMTNIR